MFRCKLLQVSVVLCWICDQLDRRVSEIELASCTNAHPLIWTVYGSLRIKINAALLYNHALQVCFFLQSQWWRSSVLLSNQEIHCVWGQPARAFRDLQGMSPSGHSLIAGMHYPLPAVSHMALAKSHTISCGINMGTNYWLFVIRMKVMYKG